MNDDFRVEYIDPIFFLRWFAAPKTASVNVLVARISELATRMQKKLHCVVLIGESLPVPNPEEREALKRLLSESQPHLHCVHLVFEGSGLKASIQRIIVDATQILARIQGNLVSVHALGEEAVTAIMKETNLPPSLMLVQARNAKLF